MLDTVPAPPEPKVIHGATGEWELVIGMEIHAQIASEAKLLSLIHISEPTRPY